MKKNFNLYIIFCILLTASSISASSQENQQNQVSVKPSICSSIMAVSNNGAVHVDWTTSTTINNYFELERSFDRHNFKTIALVLDGFDGGSGTKKYQCKDARKDVKGRKSIYYRLKEIDPNGEVRYSSIITAKI